MSRSKELGLPVVEAPDMIDGRRCGWGNTPFKMCVGGFGSVPVVFMEERGILIWTYRIGRLTGEEMHTYIHF